MVEPRSALLVAALAVGAAGQAAPAAAQTPALRQGADFVLDDLQHFNEALARLARGGDAVAIVQSEYLDRGSAGLRAFVSRKGVTAAQLVDAIREQPDRFAALAALPAAVMRQRPRVDSALVRLRELVPGAVLRPMYFLVSPWGTGGEASPEGVLVWPTDTVGLVRLLVHETVHLQQARIQGLEAYRSIYGPRGTLLALALREGTAEFVASLVVGPPTSAAWRYVLANETALWERFRADLGGSDPKDWMWGDTADPAQPRSLGYSIGARIAEAYYARHGRTTEALHALLGVTDYAGVLAASGYGAAGR